MDTADKKAIQAAAARGRRGILPHCGKIEHKSPQKKACFLLRAFVLGPALPGSAPPPRRSSLYCLFYPSYKTYITIDILYKSSCVSVFIMNAERL